MEIAANECCRNLVLTGFMGSGKSAVGRHIAHEYGLPFVDLDAVIECESGMSVTRLFQLEGESGFRKRERRAVRLVCERGGGQVVATGGGAVVDPRNRACLRRNGVVLWLRVAPETVLQRIGDDRSRPLLMIPDRERRIRALMDERAAAYADCDAVVDTDGRDIETVAQAVWRAFQTA